MGFQSVHEMGKTSGLTEADYSRIYDKIALSPEGLAFLREHARRAAQVGQSQMRTITADLRKLLRQHTETIQAAGRVEALRRELLEMAASIEQARREIAALQPKEAGSNRLLIASSELDAIVSTTERASFDILQAAERLLDVAGKLRRQGADATLCDVIDNEVTNIFTACSFQDLTGQRTSKVINALRYVEQRVNAMLTIWSMEGVRAADDGDEADQRPDAHLLSGPRNDGVNQDDVDALLSGTAPARAEAEIPVQETAQQPRTPLDQSAIDNLFD